MKKVLTSLFVLMTGAPCIGAIDGVYVLKDVACDSGSAGVPTFSAEELSLAAGLAQLHLVGAPCKMEYTGSYALTTPKNGQVITLNFTSGTWDQCSGLYPSSLTIKMNWAQTGSVLSLTGSQVFPFADCEGYGGVLNLTSGTLQ